MCAAYVPYNTNASNVNLLFIFQISCFFIAYIPGTHREPLRIAGLSKRWEPTRIPTPRFIDAWTANEKDGLSDILVPVLLGSTCENVVVLRAENMSDKERRELYVQHGHICFCSVFAKSGSGRQDATSIGGDSNVDDDDM
jgi:hypothetical protein